MQGSTIPFRPVEIQLGESAFSAAPGGSVTVPFALINHSVDEDYFDISVEGIPAEWVLLDLPVMHLASGERREASLTIQAPVTSPLSAGVYPVVLRAISQTNREAFGEAGFDLRVGGYENTMQATPYISSGRVEVALNTTQFTVTTGEVLTIPVRVTNHGSLDDTFYLTVDGIPPQWLSGPAQLARLAPGASSEFTLLIQPTLGSQSGLYPFRLRVSSQAEPSEYTIVDAMLSLAAGNQFVSDLSPRHIDAGQMARVRIHNLGAVPDTYTIRWQNQQDDLEFVPNNRGPVQVMPGETAVVDFAASPRNPNWFGQRATLPYRVTIQSSGGESQGHNGEVLSRALIPVWVLPALLMLCLTMVCGLGLLWNWNQNRLTGAKETSQAQIGLLDAQTATANAAATATVVANLTATAVGAIPVTAPSATVSLLPTPTLTLTPVPTQTVVLTFTPIPPTSTFTPLPPTITASVVPPTPTFTLPPPTSTFTPLPPTSTFTPPPVVISPTVTTQPTQSTQVPFPVPGQQVFLFVSGRDGGPHLYLFNSQDGSTRPLTSGSAVQSDPAWSPDGSRFAFTTNQDGNNEIYVMNADGTNPLNLTNSPADERYPAWSSDGSQIAFTTNRDGNTEIYVMKADGSNPVNLTKNPANDFKPAWYTQGGLLTSTSQILFTTDRDGNNEIYAVNPDGTKAVNLTQNAADDSFPAIPLGGGQVAFVTNRDGNHEIYTMQLNGSQPTRRTSNPADDRLPVWSPDGQWIAFSTNRDGNQEIYVMARDGSQVTNVTRNQADDLQPAWR